MFFFFLLFLTASNMLSWALYFHLSFHFLKLSEWSNCHYHFVRRAWWSWHQRCQTSRIRGCRMILNLTRHIWYTTVGHRWSDSGWSWTFRIGRITLHHDCEVAKIASKSVAGGNFSRLIGWLPAQILTLALYHRISWKEIHWVRDYGLECSCLSTLYWPTSQKSVAGDR